MQASQRLKHLCHLSSIALEGLAACVGLAKERQRQAIDKGLLNTDIAGVLEFAHMRRQIASGQPGLAHEVEEVARKQQATDRDLLCLQIRYQSEMPV